MTTLSKSFVYFMLILCGLSMIVPFLWMVSTSVKSEMAVNKGSVGLLPFDEYDVVIENNEEKQIKMLKTQGDSTYVHIFNKAKKIEHPYVKVATSQIKHIKRLNPRWENFSKAWNKVPFGRYFLNTIFVSFTSLFGVLITSSLAAYAFARIKFKGKDIIFYAFISMMMVPQPVYLIPSYILMNSLGWIDTFAALIVPWVANIFTIFLLRQHFKSIPQDLFDAASIDGCSRFSMLWRIALPLSKPIIATASVFSIIGSWNSFMWPLVMTNSEKLRVLQVGLSYFSQESSSQTTMLMAASTFSIMPLIILFFIAQKQIMASVASTGLKN